MAVAVPSSITVGVPFAVSGTVGFGTSFVEVGLTRTPGVAPTALQRVQCYNYEWNYSFTVFDIGPWFVYVQEYQWEYPQVFLRVSFDKGATFGPRCAQLVGNTGQTLTAPSWRRLGLGRDVVFELEWNFDGSSALNGAFLDYSVMNT